MCSPVDQVSLLNENKCFGFEPNWIQSIGSHRNLIIGETIDMLYGIINVKYWKNYIESEYVICAKENIQYVLWIVMM